MADSQTPEQFNCPMLKILMANPVVVDDGYTFQKQAILQWFRSGKFTNPITYQQLKNGEIRPNYALKSLIQKHKVKQNIKEASMSAQMIKAAVREYILKSEQNKMKQKLGSASPPTNGWGSWDKDLGAKPQFQNHKDGQLSSWQNWGQICQSEAWNVKNSSSKTQGAAPNDSWGWS